MGLDMYLDGRRYFFSHKEDEEGNRIKETSVELGYWRKHPNLHGYIVETFAEGVDECQQIELTADCLAKLMVAIENRTLPHTEGFFFGESDGSKEERDFDLKTINKALEWLANEPNGEYRSVIYQASW